MSYIPYATLSREKTDNVITFARFEEVNLLSETCDNMESCNESDGDSTRPQLINEEEMDAISSGDESDAETIYMYMLEDISDGSQSNLRINSREAG